MFERELKALFAIGYLKSATISEAQTFMGDGEVGYILNFEQKDGKKNTTITMHKRPRIIPKDGEYHDYTRVFKSVDAAIKTAKEIGFYKIELHLSEYAK